MKPQLLVHEGAKTGEQGLAATALLIAGWASVTGPGAAGWPGALLAVGLLAVVLSPRLLLETRCVVLFAALSSATTAVELPAIWPLQQVLLVVPPLLLMLKGGALRAPQPWLTVGRLDGVPALAMALLAGAALPLWVYWAEPDLDAARGMLPNWPLVAMVGAAASFSVVNAILEEVLFRGIVQTAVAQLLGGGPKAVALAVVAQAMSFGLLHWHGFPSGPSGVLLAGSWALLLGWARARTGGLLTPVVSHVVADAVIFALLALS